MTLLHHSHLTDYHIHTTFSDGRAPMEEFLPAARKAGLREIGFSEHLTLADEPVDWSMPREKIPRYLESIEKCREQYPDLTIRAGLEVDYFPEKEDLLHEILHTLPLDYVIGSIHYIGTMNVDTSPDAYEGKDMDRLYERYFGLVAGAARSGLFDFIGHLDLIEIFGFRNKPLRKEWYSQVIEALRENNTAFEVNTNGMNKPLKRFYPSIPFLEKLSEAGIPVLVNSDAHYPHRVGQFFREAYRLLEKTGFSHTLSFKNRRAVHNPFQLQEV